MASILIRQHSLIRVSNLCLPRAHITMAAIINSEENISASIFQGFTHLFEGGKIILGSQTTVIIDNIVNFPIGVAVSIVLLVALTAWSAVTGLGSDGRGEAKLDVVLMHKVSQVLQSMWELFLVKLDPTISIALFHLPTIANDHVNIS